MKNSICSLFLIILAISSSSCSDKKSPAPASFKVIGDAYRIDMAGQDGRPGTVTVPAPPPIMTKIFVDYYITSKQQYYWGDVVSTPTDFFFGFKRIDETKDVTFSKISGSPDDSYYRVLNASHAYFVNNRSDTVALKITSDTKLVYFSNPVSVAYVYKEAAKGGHIYVTQLKTE